jgi:TonB family protein
MATKEVTRAEKAPELHVVPVFVVEFDDERSRSRVREAAFISVIVHLLLFIILLLSPKWLPRLHPVVLSTSADMMRDRELTFLDLPKDTQKPTHPPESHVLSDKDRVATSRHPSIDRKTLDELRDNRREGRPGSTAPQAPASPQVASQPPVAPPTPPANQVAKLEGPPVVNRRPTTPDFNVGSTAPGSAIDQAAREAAKTRGGGGFGNAGDYGLGATRGGANLGGDVDILSDTMGFDFAPYLARIRHIIQDHWVSGIPESAYPPMRKHGKVAIDFAILKDGSVAGMKLYGPSGDVALDRAAWGGITGSNPFPPLPSGFPGEYLSIRCRFYYNPERGELR